MVSLLPAPLRRADASTSPAPHPSPPEPPRWARPAFLALLAATAALYLVGLGASGWANSFYAAAAQAGSESWSAFFFGASDAAGSITVDKTPLSLWPMALSIRVFGLSSWSLLVPQALMGVASVGLLHAVVRRATGSAGAALLAGAVLALTPVAVLMFRFDNPDALLTLLLIGSVWATLRGIDATREAEGRPVRWLALGGALVGLAFLTKMLQAFLVLPPLALVYLLYAARPWLARIGHLLVAFAAMVAAGGWWIAIVELMPADARPYIGGSQTDSILELTLGYNGLGRLNGDEVGSVGGGGGWGETGLFRLFDADLGGQVAWLLPAALVLGVAALWWTRRHRSAQAALVVWLGWLLVTALTFSFMAGIFHAYYTVVLAPAIGALVGIGGWALWRVRGSWVVSALLSATLVVTTVLAFVLLGRTPDFLGWLRWVVLGAGLLVAAVLVTVPALPRRVATAVAAAAVLVSLAGPAAYAVDTAATPHTGSIPSAGPSVAGGDTRGGPGGPGGAGGVPPGAANGTQPTLPGATTGTGPAAGGAGDGGRGRGGAGGGGGLLEATEPSTALTATLAADAADYTWVAATVGANNASGYQLATEEPVMPIGGFNGSDPSPTLAQFQQWVADGEVHWFIGSASGDGGRGGGGGGPSGETAAEITSWVEATFAATTVDGTTLYDLSTTTSTAVTS